MKVKRALISVSDKTGVVELGKALADMGSHLLEDYGKNELHLDRFKQELLDFYDLAFTVNDELAPMILKGDDGLQYYTSFSQTYWKASSATCRKERIRSPLSPIFPAASPFFHRRRHNCKKSALRRFFYFKMKKYTNDTTATKNR